MIEVLGEKLSLVLSPMPSGLHRVTCLRVDGVLSVAVDGIVRS